MPVIIPVKPCAFDILVIFSVLNSGSSIITPGGLECVYPKPGFTIKGLPITPLLTVTVAVAVVPIPTPISEGAPNLTSTVPE